MRSLLTFVAVVGGIIFIHASRIKLPETPTENDPAENLSVPGATDKLPAPAATEALVYMADSLFQSYRGSHGYFVTNHYHVLYVKTDSVYITAQGPVSPRHAEYAEPFIPNRSAFYPLIQSGYKNY